VYDTPRDLYANIQQPKTVQTGPHHPDGYSHKLTTLRDIR
jgi:hypothetical protein